MAKHTHTYTQRGMPNPYTLDWCRRAGSAGRGGQTHTHAYAQRYAQTLNPKHDFNAQAALGVVAEYDLLSGCKLGGGESGGATVALAYAPEASALIAVSAVRLMAPLCCLALCYMTALHYIF